MQELLEHLSCNDPGEINLHGKGVGKAMESPLSCQQAQTLANERICPKAEAPGVFLGPELISVLQE